MNLIGIKTVFCLLLMILFLIPSIITKEEVRIQIFSSLAIITGALSLKSLSPKNSRENE
jgi:uncharacterized membrane protein YozB (DUF420 family)